MLPHVLARATVPAPHARSPGRAATARRAPSLRRRARSAPAPRARPRRPPSRRCLARCATSVAGIDAAQVEALAARQHRHRHLADLGGGEDELHVRRRLFQRLQQRVEGLRRQHVHFVDDVDLVARRDRRVADASMISRMSSTPVWEAASISITSTWRLSMIAWQCTPSAGMVDGRAAPSRPALVVERAGEDARGRGLADAAHAGEHEGLRDAAGREGVARACAPSPPGRSGRRRSAGRYLRASTR